MDRADTDANAMSIELATAHISDNSSSLRCQALLELASSIDHLLEASKGDPAIVPRKWDSYHTGILLWNRTTLLALDDRPQQQFAQGKCFFHCTGA